MNVFGSNGFKGGPLTEGAAEAKNCPACGRLAIYVEDEVQWHKTCCGYSNRNKLKRIHIVGGPGSGKTTLAHKIGAYLNIEVHELDTVAFTGPEYADRELSERLADISMIANRPAWITEGYFILWTDQLLECANIIVWLDNVSWERSMWRTVNRFIRSALQEAKNRHGMGKFARFRDYARHMRQLVRVFFSSRVYYIASPTAQDNQIESRQNTAKQLMSYKSKVIHCCSDESVTAFLNYIYYCDKS
jgi:adenylate kinase family enzyme